MTENAYIRTATTEKEATNGQAQDRAVSEPDNAEDSTNKTETKPSKDKLSKTETKGKRTDKPGKTKKSLFGGFFSKSSNQPDEGTKTAEDKLTTMLNIYKIYNLPQLFVVKYLGTVQSRGLYGIKYAEECVDQVLEQVDKTKTIFQELQIATDGITLRDYSKNYDQTSTSKFRELIPIEYVSYGVQDVRHRKIFSYMRVKELSHRSRKANCCVYKCDSPDTCKKLTLSLALAFRIYGEKNKGHPHQFKVDLEPTTDTAAESSNPDYQESKEEEA